VSAAGDAIRAVHLDHVIGRIQQDPAQACSIGTGSFHGEHRPDAELLAPGHQLLVALAAGRKRELSELAAIGCQDHGDMEIAVGVDPDDMIERSRFLFLWQG
jgi:hypothetical protein